MTDKQIIIDGVDVSGCECIIEDYQRANNFEGRYEHIKNVCELGERGAEYYNLFCKDNPNCYYKQLKRKEQECEELRQYHNKCCEENAKKEAEWLEKYNQVSRDFYNGKYCNKENCSLLKAKEQECEELKKQWEFSVTHKMILEKNYKAELDQLKAENESWQKEYWKLEQGNDFLAEKNSRLRGCLTEIKEIASINAINTCWTVLNLCDKCEEKQDCDIQCPLFKFKLILQKISECEVEE